MEQTYEFEVAFSFLAQDEGTALALQAELQGRISSFVYSNEQKRLAGTDGESTFNKIFSELARVVVILYREEWGKTSWTRIEETAIRNRAHVNGYDFVLLIPMIEKLQTPIWFPKNRLWIGLSTYGLKSAAAAIEARVLEQDGQVKALAALDKANLLLEEKSNALKRNRYLEDNGYVSSTSEYQLLLESLNSALANVHPLPSGSKIAIHNSTDSLDSPFRAIFNNRQLTVQAKVNDNGIIQAHVTFWKGIWAFLPGYFQLRTPDKLADYEFTFAIDKHDRHGWEKLGRSKEFDTTQDLVDMILVKFVELAVQNDGREVSYLA